MFALLADKRHLSRFLPLLAATAGAVTLCLLSGLQKKFLGVDVTNPNGYWVPLLFGAGLGGLLGRAYRFIITRNLLLSHRVGQLESLLPLCCNCKKVRKIDGDPEDINSWVSIEAELESLGHEVTHGICPECMEKLYPEISKTRE